MFIRDVECTRDTPVILGHQDKPVYGRGIRIRPGTDGRKDNEHFKKIYLPELLPLEAYDLIIVLLSKRHHVNPHPCYRIGWNRCSCAMCIFSTLGLFAGIREIYPEEYEVLKKDEEILGFTLDNKKCLDDFVDDARSCVCRRDRKAVRSILTGSFPKREIWSKW